MSKYVLAFLLLGGVGYVCAQVPSMPMPPGAFMPPMKTDESMTPNLRKFGFVVCSADMKAAPGESEVTLQIEVDPTGHVTGAKALSGPERLQATSIASVMQWEFQPFEKDGKPVVKTLKVTGPFCQDMSIDPAEQKIASAYMPLVMGCLTSRSQSVDSKEQVRVCGQAAEQVEKFDPNTRFVDRRATFVDYAAALVRNKQYSEALVWAEKAVAVLKQGHDDNSGSSSVYAVKASAESWTGDMVDANADFEEAEQFERAALASPVGESHKADYSRTLKNLLTAHAQILSSLNRQSDRDAKLDEASKL